MIDSKHTNPDNPIEELLPWYVNGTLSASEKAEVDAYLAAHPEYNAEIELLKNLKDVTTADVDVPAPNSARIMQKIDQLEEAHEPSFNRRAFQFIQSLLTPNAAWAAVPAALVIATVLILMPSQTGKNGEFQTLSSGDAPAALTISVITTTKDRAALIDQMQQIAPAVDIKTGSDNQLLLIITDETKAEAALALLQNIQSLPAVKSAELVTSK